MTNSIGIGNELLKAVEIEVLPALGCTEPISLALASAIAASYTTNDIQRIKARVSPNLMKNGMGVTVPGTGMIGLPIAAAVGALGGDPEGGLQVLSSLTPEAVSLAKQFLEEDKVSVTMAAVPNILYAESTVFAGEDQIQVKIADGHTNVISIKKNDEIIFESKDNDHKKSKKQYSLKDITAKDIYEFATHIPFKDIQFILAADTINTALSEEGLKNNYGHHIGATLQKQVDKGFLSNDLLTQILIRSTAASDARMGGATLPAMSNSGSGNQGITATMPVVVVADFMNASDEERARALILSHAMAIYIHNKLPRLSALCAVTTAAMGAAAGMAWLLGDKKYEPISMAMSNMVGDLAGIICDGAANSCAMKVSTSVGSAFKSVLMALDNVQVTGSEGIVCDDVDQSIDNLCALANDSMKGVDDQIINLMINKK
ncbi:L-cysteine desulfidase family protein [Ignatzschineria sp. LJL83]